MTNVDTKSDRLPKVPGTKRWEFENGILILNLESIPNLRMSFSSMKDAEDYYDSLYKLYENEKDDVVCPLKTEFKHVVLKIKEWKKELVWAFQRVVRKHHAADIDLWDFSFYIANKLLPKLEAFRNQKFHSIPSTCNSPVHCVLEETNKQDARGKTDEGLEAWLNILDEMIYAFRWEAYVSFGQDAKKEKEFYRNYFGQDISTLDDDCYRELRRKAADRAQEGFELFGKYFTCLWD